MPPVNVTDVVDVNALPVKERNVIQQIIDRNNQIRQRTLTPQDYQYLGAVAATGFVGIRSSHGVNALSIPHIHANYTTLYSKQNFPPLAGANVKIKYCWMSYSEAAATHHAGGKIPTMVEFSGTGGGRIMLEFVRDLVIYSGDHYGDYRLVTSAGQPLRTM